VKIKMHVKKKHVKKKKKNIITKVVKQKHLEKFYVILEDLTHFHRPYTFS